jgi:hypothetical protein
VRTRTVQKSAERRTTTRTVCARESTPVSWRAITVTHAEDVAASEEAAEEVDGDGEGAEEVEKEEGDGVSALSPNGGELSVRDFVVIRSPVHEEDAHDGDALRSGATLAGVDMLPRLDVAGVDARPCSRSSPSSAGMAAIIKDDKGASEAVEVLRSFKLQTTSFSGSATASTDHRPVQHRLDSAL